MNAELTTSPMAELVRVLVVDDHRAIAELLSAMLRGQPDLDCVAHMFSADSAEEFCSTTDQVPDVAIIDVDMPGRDGIDLAESLIDMLPALRVVIMTSFATPEIFARATAVGVAAFVPKESALEDMLDAVRFSRRGSMWAPTALLQTLGQVQSASSDSSDSGLTKRELEVLTLLAQGLSVQQISRRLSLSVHTTRGYVKTLLVKLEAHSQLEAVLVAARRGLIAAVS
ncbi:MAG: response regulator transcription factor [Actinomycetes bacterium]